MNEHDIEELSSELVYSDGIHLWKEQWRHPHNDTVVEHHRFGFNTSSAVTVIAQADNEDLLTIRQYRHGPRKHLLSLPGGGLEEGEDPLVGAKRELLEETGYTANHFEVIGTVCAHPSSSLMAYFVYASGARQISEPACEQHELIQTKLMSPTELAAQLKAGAPVDCFLPTAFFWLSLRHKVLGAKSFSC